MDLDALSVNAHGVVVHDLDALDIAAQGRSAGRDRLLRHGAFEAEFHVMRGERVAIVPFEALLEMEEPAQAVFRQLPAFGHAGAEAAFLVVEPDQRIVDRRLVVGVRCAALQDRVHGLAAERFERHDQGALLVRCMCGAECGKYRGSQASENTASTKHRISLPSCCPAFRERGRLITGGPATDCQARASGLSQLRGSEPQNRLKVQSRLCNMRPVRSRGASFHGALLDPFAGAQCADRPPELAGALALAGAEAGL